MLLKIYNIFVTGYGWMPNFCLFQRSPLGLFPHYAIANNKEEEEEEEASAIVTYYFHTYINFGPF